MVRFSKLLSFRYLKNGFVSYLTSVLKTPLRYLWDVFLRCLFNVFVRHCLDLKKSSLLSIFKTSLQDPFLSLQDSYWTFSICLLVHRENGALSKNSWLYSAVDYFRKMPHIRCFTSYEYASDKTKEKLGLLSIPAQKIRTAISENSILSTFYLMLRHH